jgi:hypothetical protein
MKQCQLSKTCPKHSKSRSATYNAYSVGFNNFENSYIHTDNYKSDNEAKELLCRLINDGALKKIMSKRGIMIDKMKEIHCNNPMNCLGYNKNMGHEIAIVLRMWGGPLEYYDIIGIVLHEITHCDHMDHDIKFKNREEELRDEYLKIGSQYNCFPIWDKPNLPPTNGRYLMIVPEWVKIYRVIYYMVYILFLFASLFV